MYLHTVLSKKIINFFLFLLASWKSLAKRAGSGSVNQVRTGYMDTRIRIRTKMKSGTLLSNHLSFQFFVVFISFLFSFPSFRCSLPCHRHICMIDRLSNSHLTFSLCCSWGIWSGSSGWSRTGSPPASAGRRRRSTSPLSRPRSRPCLMYVSQQLGLPS